MSIFLTAELPCPTCGTQVSFELVHSVNADRRPDLRQAILERRFQRQQCPGCELSFRVEPEFTYMDVGRRQFFAVWPASKIGQWKALEARSQTMFDKAFGNAAPPEARAIGARLEVRVVFGWAALNEKLIAAEHGIDDRKLELVKVGALRNIDEMPVGAGVELRLVGVAEDELKLGWIETAVDELTDVLGLPLAALAEIDADPAPWQELRDEIAAGLFVDYKRALIPA
jgi:hypothetical protein